MKILHPLTSFAHLHISSNQNPSISSSRNAHSNLKLSFCCLKSLRTLTPNHSKQFRASYKFPKSLFSAEPQLSDADEEEEDDEEDDDDDDEEAAEEYEDFSGEVSDGAEQSEDEFEISVDDISETKSRFEEFKWQRVERLRNEVREFGEEIIDANELASVYDFRIDKFQRLAIQAFLRGSSVVVSAPTSSGKTLVGEAAAVATVARGRRIFYTTPLKALSNQKFREFRETFGDNSVGLLTGDSAVNKDAQVLIMTTEILRNMLYQSIGMVSSESGLFHVDVIVLDEVHYLSDISRGTVWEEIVIYCPKEVQLICLSATVANPDELAGWIAQVPQVIDTLWHLHSRDMLPAIWFIFSRKGCDAAVQYLEDCKLLDECEMSEVELALKRFRIQYPDAFRESSMKGLLRGVAAHHAGCLPLWKSFVEELFQRGLVKVVFATETLAAGINMPARTASGRIQLNSNELLQMAGRAGRRGIDKRGHVVLLQTPYEGAEECCKLLFSGLEPLVSQFTASYGMVLNLLAGGKVTRRSNESDDMKVSQAGRTLEEARKLVEQSFGNYVGSNVMLAAKEELTKIQKEIEMLTSEISDEAIDRKSRKLLSDRAYKEIADLQEELRVYADDSSSLNVVRPEFYCGDTEKKHNIKLSYYVALGSDNSWYLFTEKWIKKVYKTGLPNVALARGDALPREIMRMLLDKEEMQWQKLSNSELGGFWSMEGSLETWSWSLNVPVLSSLSEDDEVSQFSQAYHAAVESYKDQRNKVSRLKKKISRTEGFREYKKIVDMAKFTEEKIRRLKARSNRLIGRIEQIEPSGWKEFLQVSNVIHEARALDINTHMIFPLGETAAAIRGENELWLAMVLRNKVLLDLKPAQLAAVCGSLVSEGIKVRPWKNNSFIYEPSSTVIKVINFLDEQRSSLVQLQEKHGVKISCCLDSQFSGMVEAWASGLTWREIMMDCAMDEGDLARLLRRTIDILAQVPKLPDIDPLLQSNAVTASNVMDRPPISELAG
ncbi:hypothetical protein LOK49_LG03G00370 [Camellia lanceoleosa]|uniref:Uncharacterized protein n=1 Tax=Camellia lanceoleosa TaxID=1840588 RepID=A0ACC0IEH5_9ERIC|nr:hypothetical protein LOK49_LG03G00370 [Camellia lanceoleosa]